MTFVEWWCDSQVILLLQNDWMARNKRSLRHRAGYDEQIDDHGVRARGRSQGEGAGTARTLSRAARACGHIRYRHTATHR